MDNLVLLRNNEPLTTSLVIARELKRSHKSIIQLIRNHENDFNDFGTLTFEMRKSKGRPTEFVYLNEQQLTFLIMILKSINNDKVLEFKKRITKEFFIMRKWILEQKTQKQNQNYIETRNQSKLGRRQQTDIIKEFVDYAKKQGSKSAEKYYINISRMENQAFFIIKEKFPNIREILRIDQLSKIIVADMIIKETLKECMIAGIYYKDIFKEAKNRVIKLSNDLGGKEEIPSKLIV